MGRGRHLRQRCPHALRHWRPPGAWLWLRRPPPRSKTAVLDGRNFLLTPTARPPQMFFTTGKSARKRVSDNTLDMIQDRLKPHLRAGRFYEGVNSGVTARAGSTAALAPPHSMPHSPFAASRKPPLQPPAALRPQPLPSHQPFSAVVSSSLTLPSHFASLRTWVRPSQAA